MGRCQFSLRTLLASVALVGIGAALWVAEPSPQVGAIEVVLASRVPTLAAIVGLKTLGKSKTWWFGNAVTLAMLALLYTRECVTSVKEPGLSHLLFVERFATQFSLHFRGLLLMSVVYAPVVGLLCVLTQWLLVRPASAERKD